MNRDTQFQGFAKLLWEELPPEPYSDSLLSIELSSTMQEWKAATIKLIAQRAYDLVFHSVHQLLLFHNEQHSLLFDEAMEAEDQISDHVQDMAAWPDSDVQS